MRRPARVCQGCCAGAGASPPVDCRRQQVEQCIARNGALGQLREAACEATFEGPPLSPLAQAAQLQRYVDQMQATRVPARHTCAQGGEVPYCWHDLQALLDDEGGSFDRVNVSTALHHLGSVLGHERAQAQAVSEVDTHRRCTPNVLLCLHCLCLLENACWTQVCA